VQNDTARYPHRSGTRELLLVQNLWFASYLGWFHSGVVGAEEKVEALQKD